jgi:surface protein
MLILFLILALTKTVNACTGSTNPPICDPLPNGNKSPFARSRVGSLGGVVDDLYQDYFGGRPLVGSMTTEEVIAKYGPIETWDTSQVTDMNHIFVFKDDINPDIRKWQVNNVVDMGNMFSGTNAFNIDLSGWNVSSVTIMDHMFFDARAFNQVLCGKTWVESTADQGRMFAMMFATHDGSWVEQSRIATENEICCVAATAGGSGNNAYTTDCGNVTSGSNCTLTCSATGYSGTSTRLCTEGSFAALDAPTCIFDGGCTAATAGGSGNNAYTTDCGNVASGSSCTLTCSATGYSGTSTRLCTEGSFAALDAPTCTTCNIADMSECTVDQLKEIRIEYNRQPNKPCS